MDDEIVKAMKVIRLKDGKSCQYLTAGDDQVSITLTKPKYKYYIPKNTEWRVEWLNNSPKGLVRQVRLWSIYNKALTFAHDLDDYCSGSLKQRSWPPSHGDSEQDFEWQFELRRKNKGRNKDYVGVAYPQQYSKSKLEHLLIRTRRPSLDNKSMLHFHPTFEKQSLRWENNVLLVEVVVTDDNQKILTTLFEQPLMLRHDSANKVTISLETSTPVKNGDHESSNHLCHDKSLIDHDTNLSTIVNQKASAPPDQPRSLVQSPVCNKFTSVRIDQEGDYHKIHDKSLIDQEETQNASVSTKTSTPPEHKPCMHYNHGAKYNDIGQLHDCYTNMLPRWQVGQVFLNLFPTPIGIHASPGYKYSQYTNSGGNVNGSGVQNNGDISMYSEINRSRDNNTNFVNYGYE
ncbi:hypothetical protein RND81_14G248300 [Saponaria officinalis]|uniref:Uncharacterized protein n=1 Tax=Saponaria officinalis TaxID=3572 RepID=A0AAW1GTI1_SAPOF